MQTLLTFTGDFKWRERLGIEPRNPITITAFTGQRDHIVTNLISEKKSFHSFNLPHPHFITKRWVILLFINKNPATSGHLLKLGSWVNTQTQK